jgi:hypothetical protein
MKIKNELIKEMIRQRVEKAGGMGFLNYYNNG